MKTLKLAVCSLHVSLLLAALLFTPVAHAQDANKVLEQYIKAVGGGKALSKLQTLTLDGTFAATGAPAADPMAKGEVNGTYTLAIKQPNRYYSELRENGKVLIEAYNGKSAWHQTANGEINTLLGAQALELEAAAQYYNSRFQNLSKKKIGAALVGRAQVNGADTLQVRLTYPTGVTWDAYFDPNSHLVVKEAATIGGVPQEIYYSDYRAVNGVKVPHKIELKRGGQSYKIGVTRAGVNEAIGERVFDFPVKSQVKLPDLKKLFEEIDANQKQIDKIRENYAGTRAEESTEFDKTGKVTKREQREFTFFYLNGAEISTLVKKDGTPLSEEEQEKENGKTRKAIEENQKQEKKKEAKEEKAKESGKEDKDEPGIEVFLRACQFVNPRRERFRGQDVLVFDFEPNPEYKPKNMEERVVKELAGVIWIDEKALDVARLEAYFISDVHIGGGLVANLQKGTSFIFEQAYQNNEVWLPTYTEVHLGVRVLMVKGFKINEVTHYSDYKRFNVETLNTIAKPPEKPAAEPGKPQ